MDTRRRSESPQAFEDLLTASCKAKADLVLLFEWLKDAKLVPAYATKENYDPIIQLSNAIKMAQYVVEAGAD